MASQTESTVVLPDGTSYQQPVGLFINGELSTAQEQLSLDTINPYTGKTICSIARGRSEDINAAVSAAQLAFKVWKDTPPRQRGQLLQTLAGLIRRDADILAKIEAVDAGKPVHIAKEADVLAAAACIEYYAGWADKIKGETVETDPKTLNLTVREPVGVCGLIIPWNFPILMVGWKLAPALAAGNTAVLKPAELTPLSALYVGKLIQEAGFPPGVVNIVTGLGVEAGAALASHPGVSKISFTGSTPVGKGLLRASADSNLKKITLELGGKSPSVIFNDADLDDVVEWVNGGIFYNMGQNCCAGSRVYVQEGVYEAFLSKFVKRAEKNVMGDPFHEKTFLGPQISAAHHEKIMGMIEKAKAQGAVVATGGKSPHDWFIEPTIFRDVSQDMDIMQEEVFGPVIAVAPFKDVSDALAKGLSMAKSMEAGTVWVNCYNMITHALPFGGCRESGIGKDLGENVLSEFTNTKSIRIML
ncbi:hypothetical protein G7054_g9957 [Neopestalotiopsis clavispora]|nr:hypothetical protein G7054_g9957 [Neopestalotiopsis clavispora]